MMVAMSVCGVKPERIHITTAKTTKPAVVIQRGSHCATLRPASGDSRMASTPTGASAIPAWVAV